MPIYEYKCSLCKREMEELRPIKDREYQVFCEKDGCKGLCTLQVSTGAFVMDPAVSVKPLRRG